MQIDLGSIGLNQSTIDRLASGVQDFGPRTPFSDWRDAANELARESEEEVAERALELYNEVDPGRGSSMGRSTADLAYKEIVQDPLAKEWMEVYEREGLPPYKVDPETGEKFYINTPPGVNLVDLLEGEDKQEYLDLLQKQDFEVRASSRVYNVETGVGGSGAGSYGTVIRAPEVTGADRLKAIATPVIASAMLGPLAGKIAGTAGLGTTGTTALTKGLTSAATAGLQGADLEDALKAGLLAGATSFVTDAISDRAASQTDVPETTVQAPEVNVELPEFVPADAVNDTIAKVSEEISNVGASILDDGNIGLPGYAVEGSKNFGKVLTDVQQAAFDRTLDQVISEVGIETFNSPNFSMGAYLASKGNPILADLGLATATQEAFLSGLGWVAPKAGEFTGMLSTAGAAPLTTTPETVRTIANIERIDTATGNLIVDGTPIPVDDVVLTSGGRLEYTNPETGATIELTTQQFPGATTTVEADLETLLSEKRPVVDQSYLQVEQAPSGGGGGGALGGTGLAGGAATTTSGSVSVTPTIDYTAPGAVTSSFFSDFINPAAVVYSGYTTASPMTPVATTAPTTEPTQPTTTEPTSIFEDTTDDTTTAPVTTGGGSTGGVEDPISTGGAEGAGAEGGASGGADDGSGTEGDKASGQEGGDDTAGDGTTAGGGAGDAGDAEGAGEGTGEGEGTGDGTGTGDGSGDGSGRGSGLGGMGGAGAGGGLFSDYEDPYNAPALLKRALPLEGYTPIDVANQIENLRSFSFLEPQQVRESLSLFGNPLLEESVMQKLYKTGN